MASYDGPAGQPFLPPQDKDGGKGYDRTSKASSCHSSTDVYIQLDDQVPSSQTTNDNDHKTAFIEKSRRYHGKHCNISFTMASAIAGLIVGLIIIITNFLLLAVYSTPRFCFGKLLNSSFDNCTNCEEFYNLKKYFIIAVIGGVVILRIIQYYLLSRSVYKFVELYYERSYTNALKWFLKLIKNPNWKSIKCTLFLWGLLVSLLLALSMAIPTLGFVTESRSCKGVTKYVINIFNTWSYLRYFMDTLVIFSMILATLAIRNIWFPDGCTKALSAAVQSELEQERIKAQLQTPATVHGQEELELDASKCFKLAAEQHRILKLQYDKTGEKASQIISIYDKWFLLPLIVYVILASLTTSQILQPFDAEQKSFSLPSLTYLVYTIASILEIVLTYSMAILIDSYEHKYYQLMRDLQLREGNEMNSITLAYAQTLKIEENMAYRFMARLGWSHVRIAIKSPLFVLTLFLPIFLYVSEGLKLL